MKPAPSDLVAKPDDSAAAHAAVVDQTSGRHLSVVDTNTGATTLSFNVPALASDVSATAGIAADSIQYGQNLSISVHSQRLIAACKLGGIPSLIQYDLGNGKIQHTFKITEIDPGLSGSTTGLAYSNDGQKLAALFENGGSALLLAYDASTGKKLSNFVYPAGPLEGAPHWLFRGSAICWLDPSPVWLVYGQGVVSTQTGAHLKSADLHLTDSGEQRSLQGDRVELLTNTTAGKKLLILQLDRTHLDSTTPN